MEHLIRNRIGQMIQYLRPSVTFFEGTLIPVFVHLDIWPLILPLLLSQSSLRRSKIHDQLTMETSEAIRTSTHTNFVNTNSPFPRQWIRNHSFLSFKGAKCGTRIDLLCLVKKRQ